MPTYDIFNVAYIKRIVSAGNGYTSVAADVEIQIIPDRGEIQCIDSGAAEKVLYISGTETELIICYSNHVLVKVKGKREVLSDTRKIKRISVCPAFNCCADGVGECRDSKGIIAFKTIDYKIVA